MAEGRTIPLSGVPAAVQPGAHDEVIRRVRAGGLDPPEGFQRAEQVFGVEPAADSHHGRPDLLEMRPNVASFPEFVVGAVTRCFIPKGDLVLEVLGVRAGERTHA